MTTRSRRHLHEGDRLRGDRRLVPKLDPRTLIRNPVIFIVELGSVVTTVIFFRDLFSSDDSEPLWFTGTIALWLWLTVLFANFAEAVAEGRGKAQANALRATRTTTMAFRRTAAGALEEVPAPDLQRGDIVVVEAGQVIPADGEIVEGVGSVDESAITGESAPVIREAGGDRSAVTGGTRLLSDSLVIEVTQEPGRSFLDRMIALVEGAERRKTPNEIALNILLAGLTITFVVATVTLRRSRTTPARRCPRPSSSRCSWPSSRRRSARCSRQSASPAWTGSCSATCSPCPAAPSRPRATSTSCCSTRPARSRSATARRPSSCRFQASRRSSWPRSRSSRRSPTRRPKVARSSCSPRSSSGSASGSSASSTSSCRSPPRHA